MNPCGKDLDYENHHTPHLRHPAKTRAVIQLEKLEEACVPTPSFTLDIEQAQTLMDDLWNAGIRPTEGSGSAGAMRAVERHLEDMRTLVFHPIKP
jgi:hypothetical protein